MSKIKLEVTIYTFDEESFCYTGYNPETDVVKAGEGVVSITLLNDHDKHIFNIYNLSEVKQVFVREL